MGAKPTQGEMKGVAGCNRLCSFTSIVPRDCDDDDDEEEEDGFALTDSCTN